MLQSLSRTVSRLLRPGSIKGVQAGGGVPVELAISLQDKNRLRGTLETLLQENILAYWYPQVIDDSEGGYLLNHDVHGVWQGSVDKQLTGQARTVWFFSRLAAGPYGKAEHLRAAQHGFDFLSTRLWDTDAGGFYWSVSSSGQQVTRPGKHLYAQAFGLYAVSAYALASGEERAVSLAHKLFNLMEQHAHDTDFSGYAESLSRDWTTPPAEQMGYLHYAPQVKTFNTHLHLLEALTVYYRLSNNALAGERLSELVEILSDKIIHEQFGACTDSFHRDWTPVISDRRVSYGHDLENISLLVEACRTAGMPLDPLLNRFHMLFSYALKYGYDRKLGGFYESGLLGKRADRYQKVWWVQAEAMLAALTLYDMTGDERYRECFEGTLSWVLNYQIDWQYGDWHSRINRRKLAYGSKGDAWKSPYHNARALMDCLNLLRVQPQD